MEIEEAIRTGNVKDIYLPYIGEEYGHEYDGVVANVVESHNPSATIGSVDLLLHNDDTMLTLGPKFGLKSEDYIRIHTRKKKQADSAR